MFGGQLLAGGSSDETWVFTQSVGFAKPIASGPSPSARHAYAATWFASRNSLLLFGGSGPSGDSWELSLIYDAVFINGFENF